MIIGNHVPLVAEGRAGSDVVVKDSARGMSHAPKPTRRPAACAAILLMSHAGTATAASAISTGRGAAPAAALHAVGPRSASGPRHARPSKLSLWQ
jgi:hypothetical protein